MAQHPLFRKRGMDAVNQELLQETDYPAADKDYNNPWGSKGTEFDPTKMGSLPASALARMITAAGTGPGNKVDYLKLAEAIAASLDLLSRVAPKGGHIQAFAEDGTVDLRNWVAEDRRGAASASAGRPTTASRGLRRVSSYTCSDCGHRQNSNVSCEKCGNACSFQKAAEIKMHEAPKFLPPRNDMRSHLDDDVKKEMEADLDDKTASRRAR